MIREERPQARRLLLSPSHLRPQEQELQAAVQQGQHGEDEEGSRLAPHLEEESTKRRPDEDTECEAAQSDPHGVAPLLVLRIVVRQHSEAGHAGAGGAEALQGPGHEEDWVAVS